MKLDKNMKYYYDAKKRKEVGKVDERLKPYELSSRRAYDLWLVLVDERIPTNTNPVKELRFRMPDTYTSDEVCLEAMEELINAGYLQVEKKKISFCPYGFHRNSMEEFEADVLKNSNCTHTLSADHAQKETTADQAQKEHPFYKVTVISPGEELKDADGNIIRDKHRDPIYKSDLMRDLRRIKCIQRAHRVTPYWAKECFDLADRAGIQYDSGIDKAPLLPNPEREKPKFIDITSIHA